MTACSNIPATARRGATPSPEALGRVGDSRDPRLTFVRHHITNPLIEVGTDTATARSYFAVHCDIGLDHSGTYSDRLVRTADGWRFGHRLVRVDWQSPTSLFRPMATRNSGSAEP